MSILTSSGVRRSRWALSFADLLLLLLGFFVMLHASGQRRDVMLAQVRQQFGGHVRRAMEIRAAEQLGRASGRERVCQYVWISVVAVTFKKHKQRKTEISID